jgi:hypothetical protein
MSLIEALISSQPTENENAGYCITPTAESHLIPKVDELFAYEQTSLLVGHQYKRIRYFIGMADISVKSDIRLLHTGTKEQLKPAA